MLPEMFSGSLTVCPVEMIPSEFIDDLLARTDIVDLIDQYVPLKKGGANYMACCPFHKEKSPSFSVSPGKQFYHCFGCGAHGSAIGFVMEYQGLSFTEAVQLLADRAGMAVPQVKGGRQENAEQRAARKQQQDSLEQTVQTAADFYTQQLSQHLQAQNYLQKRGLSAEIAKHYGIGYAPEGWQPLSQAFKDYPNPFLLASGMVVDNEGKQYDRFRHRIMFPIRAVSGRIIGFGGRVLDDSKPKYLNSPDTPLFDKGKNLYGLYEAREAIRDKGRVLVVEGYMDVVALAQFGIGYAVAALGTATTADHIKLLMRHSDDIYFCFDGDTAGKKAAWRALENALPQLQDGKSLHFLFLPEQHDPDSYIRQYGEKTFEDMLLHQSKPLSAYFWDALTEHSDLQTQEGKAELVKQAAPLLKQIAAPTLSFLLKQELSQKTGIDPANLAYLMGQAAPQKHVQARTYKLPQQDFRQPETVALPHKQIRTLLFNPQWAEYVVFPDYLALEGDLGCLAELANFFGSKTQATAAQAIEHYRDTIYAPTIEHIFSHTLYNQESFSDSSEEKLQEFRDGIVRLIQDAKNVQIEYLKQRSKVGLSSEEKKLLLQLLKK